MENSLKGLLIAAGTIVTCLVIGLGFWMARESRDSVSKGIGQINKLNAEFTESDKSMYDGISISGSEVINVINKFRSESIGIVVNTTKTKNTYYIRLLTSVSENGGVVYTLGNKTNTSIKNAQNMDDPTYINQNAQFMGEILRDTNKVIVGIRFEQE